MRVLFANHTASMSGAEHAMLRLLEAVRDEHEVAVACPEAGALPEALERAGIRRLALPAFEASFRPHPLHTPHGMARLGWGGIVLAALARRLGAQVLYANTTRAALMGGVARRLGGPPLVVRVHDLLPRSAFGRAVRGAIAASADAVLAVSDYTAERFNDGLRHPLAARVYNGIDLTRFDPARVAPARLGEELGLGPDALLLGQVAQITPWKGQAEAIRIVFELRRRGLDAHLVIVGEIAFAGRQVRYDNTTYLRRLHQLVDELELADVVHFLGSRQDVPALLRAFDLSLLPSWEEPAALAVVESLAMGTPAFVSVPGGAAEIVEDGVSGRTLPVGQPEVWAAAIHETLRDPEAVARMSTQAPKSAARFRQEAHAEEIVGHLQRVAAAPALPRYGLGRVEVGSDPMAGQARWPN